MEKRTTRFLNISLIVAPLLCIAIFIGQVFCVNWMGEDAIRQLGVFYMSGTTKQVSSHFGTIIELRLSQVESIVHAVPPARSAKNSSRQIELTYNARSAGFEYLAFYTADGSFDMIYGPQVAPDVSEALRQSVQGGKNNVCAGTDETGTPVVLIGVPANYPMSDGSTSVALVAGLPANYLRDTLERNLQSNIIGFSIIRNDGSYVLHNGSIQENNYFDRIERLYETFGGKTPAEYAKEFRSALDADIDYTSEVMFAGERWNVYCTNLPNSDWHLLLKISHNTMDETVHLLQRRWSSISVSGCILIVVALLFIFARYYRLTKMQMKALEQARETAEQAQRSAERSNKAKNEFLSNMSHDIRTPMNGIMGMTSIAISSLDDPPRVRSCLKKIYISSRHLLGLITDMLDMSKIESGNLILNMEPVSLREVMQNVATIIQPQIQEKKQHFCIYIYDIYREDIWSDRVRLSQVLLNILGNCVKFTPEGGVISAELYEDASPLGNEYVRSYLYVRDNGVGMSKEFLPRIFEPFAREDSARVDSAAGAGMGMTITKHIVDAMGGTITVESEKGKGTEFHITLDLEITARQEKLLRLPHRNILVIDDDELGGRLACAALGSIGLHGETAADVDQAIQMVEERRDQAEPFHILLLDWNIRGEYGLQTAEKLSSRLGPELPVILLTDGEWIELETPAEEAGIRGFIAKPLFRSTLYYGLRPFIEDKTQMSEQAEEEAADLTGVRILVAEDNEMNWEIASDMLGEYGLELEWAENGRICVDKFEASEPGWYDGILMDLRMPIMTGFEAAEAIRKLERKDAQSIPIIAVSADTFEDDIQKCFDCGMNAHTAKPMDPDKVLALLSQYLRP